MSQPIKSLTQDIRLRKFQERKGKKYQRLIPNQSNIEKQNFKKYVKKIEVN
jgi:hypothetical protein